MNIQENVSLKEFNTYAVEAKARYFIEVTEPDQIEEVFDAQKFKDQKKFVLGGGSNLLFVKDYEGLIIKMNIKGKEVVDEEVGMKNGDKGVRIKVYAGEDWDSLVRWSVENNYGGLENLVFIPGTFGGAVAQNIAAYGQNIMDVIKEVYVFDREEEEYKTLSLEQCEFDYRDSIFKRKPDKFIIISADIVLEKDPDDFELNYHERKGRYGSLVEALETVAESPYNLTDVMNAVEWMRRRRLPTVEEYGTCGSYFANPVVTVDKFREIRDKFGELQCYPVEKLSYEIKDWDAVDGMMQVKIPAGWLIDEMGYLNHWEENVGISPTHALCLVSNKSASGEEIKAFGDKVKQKVRDMYGVDLREEVIIVE